ncbi:hypothetical protein DNTS_009175 [Danionella cerebrum]|uniref:SEA domain-containing protein n=1 Tax=Danionella cerebrum TaxID=2873325 RepID=A0A553QB03_9TELE|nr:hypothetical protein DNTS_009175 [Danionella translucida]
MSGAIATIIVIIANQLLHLLFLVYYRAEVNFTNSFKYVPELEDIYSAEFIEISSAVVDTLESEYNRIPGQQTVNVVLIK